jgi:hypothetical protein
MCRYANDIEEPLYAAFCLNNAGNMYPKHVISNGERNLVRFAYRAHKISLSVRNDMIHIYR